MATAVLDRLEEELAELCGHVNALNASIVRVVAAAMDSGGWHGPGLHSPAHWVAWKTGMSMANAHRVMRLVERRGELPVTFVAFEAGELSIDQVTPIVERAPAYADREVCEFARAATVTQIRRVVRAYPFDPDPSEPAKHPKERGESFTSSQGDDGRWRLRGELDADHGLIVDAALREARDALFDAHGATSNVAALVELAERSLDAVTSTARRDRFRIHVHIAADGQMRDPLGHILDVSTRRQLTCDAIWSPTYTDRGLPISVGRSQYIVPDRTRREILHRDGGQCVVPGCTGTGHHLEIHHIVHREDGGGHDTWNLACLCPRHHRSHHRGLLDITGDADVPGGLTFTDANGHPIRAGPTIAPPTKPPPAPAGRYRHPSGERLNTRWISFNPPPAA
jgi:Domain of unknown function (DUF222)